MGTFTEFTKKVQECLAEAEELYGPLPEITIRLDLKGRSAGQAGFVRGKYYVRFNREAILNHWDDMVNSTIPHEVAHVVDHIKNREMNHGAGWQRIDAALGGDGKRCHNYTLTPAKKRRVFRYRYVTDLGTVALIGPKHHNTIQRHYHSWSSISIKRTGEKIMARHFQEAVQIR